MKKDDNDTPQYESISRAERARRSRAASRNSRRMAQRRKASQRRMASRETLEKRARQQARNAVADRFLKGKKRSELSVPEKEALERRLRDQSEQISRLANRMLPEVIKKERERVAALQSDDDENVNEGYTHRYHHRRHHKKESNPKQLNMVLTQLSFIRQAVEDIEYFAEQRGSVPEWFQNKLTKAHSEIESLNSYMIGKDGRDDYLNESAVNKRIDTALDVIHNSSNKVTNDIIIQLWNAVESDSPTTRLSFGDGSAVFTKEDCENVLQAHEMLEDSVSKKKFRRMISESYINMLKASAELLEKLSPDDSMGDWIRDFYKSDAPQFRGKSKEKRREMAIAAKLAADERAADESDD